MRPRGIASRRIAPNRTTAPVNMSFQQPEERMATLADSPEENIFSSCDPGSRRARDEEKRLGPSISAVTSASLAHPDADSSSKPLSRPE
eukprot:704322-Pyramimonas_sp.AAC.1